MPPVAERGKSTGRRGVPCVGVRLITVLPRLALAISLTVGASSLSGCGSAASGSGPDLTVSISHQSSAEGATFTIFISNVGNAAVTGPVNLTLSGTVVPPAAITPGNGWSCVSSSAHGSPPQFAACTNPGPIPPGAGGNIVVAYNITTVFTTGNPVNPPTSYGLSIDAQVSAPGNVFAGASDGVSIPLTSGASASLSFRLIHVGSSFAAGGTGSYVFGVQNTGDVESGGPVDVVVNLPPGFIYAFSSGVGWVCGGGEVVGCAFAGTIAPGATSDVTLNVLVDASISGTATSIWSTSLDAGGAASLLMSDMVLVESATGRRLATSP